MALLSGRQLKKIVNHFCPFESNGSLKPKDSRVTLLASNANLPLEVEMRAFTMAASQGAQSPMIVQMSHHALRMTGGDPKDFEVDGVKYKADFVRDGAVISELILRTYAEEYDARYVALSLDHFAVPHFDVNAYSKTERTSDLNHDVARAKIEAAKAFTRPVFNDDAELTQSITEAYINYLSSDVYLRFKADFVEAVNIMKPAWGMIDTEELPPILNFVVTRDISDTVRNVLNNKDVMIEAEFGATGQSGERVGYKPLRGEELDDFARKIVSFVEYTGAEGLAYPIGMAHAAKLSEKHEPDTERLETVQRALFLRFGENIPFAQHGGSGAAYIERGLVGKTNINTRYLVAAANAFADHYEDKKDSIRRGVKDSCGTKIYTKVMIPTIVDVTVSSLKETGSYLKGAELRRLMF